MDVRNIICIMILIAVVILDTIDINNLIKRRNADKNKDKNKDKYILSFLLYGLVMVASIYFAFDIILDNIIR